MGTTPSAPGPVHAGSAAAASPAPKTIKLSDEQAQRVTQLVRQLARERYDAENVDALCRIVYVRTLLKIHEVAGGRTKNAIPLAHRITASVLKLVVGFHFTADAVAEMLRDPDDDPDHDSAGKRRSAK